MSQPDQKIEFAVWGGLIVIVAVIVVTFAATQFRRKQLPVYATLSGFTLTNQDNRTVTLDGLRGQTWIADVIFTRCPSQCLVMSQHMKEIQAGLPSGSNIQLVSFTTDPAFDKPPVMKKYAERFGAQDGRWSFLTGDKSMLRKVEVDDLKLPVVDKSPAEQDYANDLFIHSEKFVLIDKLGQVRGYFDGQLPTAVTEVLTAAKSLQ